MSKARQVRFAVVGTGWFAQEAVLPAFANASNAKLVAIVSGDPVKQKELGQRYGVPAYGYEQYGDLLEGGQVDAVYIVLPNSMHKDYAVKAAAHKVHVLCEKPLAGSAAECREMIAACEDNNVRLMTAYRLHFEPGNLAAVEAIRDGKIGEPRVFHGINCQTVEEGNTRLDADLAGGPLLDVGIYCVNAARYLFQDDPVEVSGFAARTPSTKFREVPEMVTAVMRFPNDRLATFSCGFGEAKVSAYRVVGTTGDLRMDPAYTFRGDLYLYLTRSGKTTETRFRERDQVGAEIVYFADCVLNERVPEPDGYEGLADLVIIDAIKQSAQAGRAVPVGPFKPKPRPSAAQEMKLSKVSAPDLVNAAPPSKPE